VHSIAQLPVALCGHSSVIVGSHIYIYGGTDGLKFFDDVYIYDIVENEVFKCNIENNG
jgi:hypothetical protein